jgi:uncharacterized protein (TIGR02453 family)
MPPMPDTTPFTGFHPDAIDFLVELAENNERSWFQPRKAEYERLLRQPMQALVAALAERLADRGVPLRADPERSVFRIHRDTRFAKDKTPYKTNVAARFPWIGEAGEPEGGAHTNGGYLSIQPGQHYQGGGLWMADRERLQAFRQAIIDDPGRVRRALEDPGFVAVFGSVATHESLKRTPPGWPPDHELADMFRWKDIVFGRALTDDEIFDPGLPDLLADGYAAAMPVFRFLATLRP